MQHFISKIINKQEDESVHRRFIKFSTGAYPDGGPVLRMKVSKKNNLTIDGSFEYEDLIGYYVAKNLPGGTYKIGGNIYTQPRVKLDSIRNSLKEIALDNGWEPGKRDLKKLFMRPVDLELQGQDLIPIYETLANDCYLLLTITPEKGKDWTYKTKDKIPPLKKTYGKADPYGECKDEKKLKCKNAKLCKESGICLTDRIKFCRVKTGVIKDLNEFFELFIPDFPNIGSHFAELVIINQYTINKLIFPEDKETLQSHELREKIKRAGILERNVYIDGEMHSNKIEFVV
ncbi:MAG: hypothetical protein ACTSQ8_15835 [Candidatus Helarchaeota archaeon]